MQKLGLSEEQIGIETAPRKGFWRRQFQMDSTEPQRYFDWIFGVILPVVCFVFDPTVFKGSLGGTAILGTYKPFAYILSFASVMAMSAWLIWGGKLRWLGAALTGIFTTAGLISLAIGVVLAPFSLLGLIILIGILGFTPLLTSIVYLRAAFRSFQTAKPLFRNKILINSFVLGAVFSLVFPLTLNLKIKQTLNEMENGDAQTIRSGGHRLKYIAPIVNFDALARSYGYKSNEPIDERRAALAEVYLELTGAEISTARVLND